MKLKKKHFKKLKEIAVVVNEIVPGTGIRLDKLIAEIESVQRVKTIQEKQLRTPIYPVPDSVHKGLMSDIRNRILRGVMYVPDTDPKIGDVGYFWDSIKQGVYYGILGTISKFEVFKYIPLGYKGNQFKNFSKTPPELK